MFGPLKYIGVLDGRFVTIEVSPVEFARFDGPSVPMWSAVITATATFDRNKGDGEYSAKAALDRLGLKYVSTTLAEYHDNLKA